MSEAILPCPFCGRDDELIVYHNPQTILHPWFRIECGHCGAKGAGSDRVDHVELWNTRAASARIAELTALLAESQDALSVASKGLMELSLEVRGLDHPAVPSLELRAAEAGWVSVDDRLPDLHQSVALLCVRRWENVGGDWDRNIHDAGYLDDYGHRPFWSIRQERSQTLGSYTHWMPLPAPPESGQQGRAPSAATERSE